MVPGTAAAAVKIGPPFGFGLKTRSQLPHVGAWGFDFRCAGAGGVSRSQNKASKKNSERRQVMTVSSMGYMLVPAGYSHLTRFLLLLDCLTSRETCTELSAIVGFPL